MAKQVDLIDYVPLRGLRACLMCTQVKSFRRFVLEGCENCEILAMKNCKKQVYYCTSRDMDIVTVQVNENESNSLSQRLKMFGYCSGTYAMGVPDSLPTRIKRYLKTKGVKYKERRFLMDAYEVTTD